MSKSGLRKLCSFFVVGFCIFEGTVVCQEIKTATRQTKTGMETFSYTLIPDASEPCTVVECAWWKQLQKAGNDLQKNRNEYYKKKFVALFVEGMEKSYHVPIKDRPAKVLVPAPQIKTDGISRTQKNGMIQLLVEVRADASIGEVTVVKELGPELDQRYIQSARQILFLPAVKNHVFVDDRLTLKYSIFKAGWAK